MSDIVVNGCPAYEGRLPCITTCAGNWPGTKITSEALTRAVKSGRLDVSKLGCGILQEAAEAALKIIANDS